MTGRLVGSIATVATVLAGVMAISQAHTAGDAACVASPAPPPQSPAYADTPWPTEHADMWRTHAAPTGLPANVRRAELATTSATLPEEPVWGYVGTGGKLYVIGGSPYLLNMFTALMQGASTDRIPTLTARTLVAARRVTPYVAQIDARTMKVRLLRLERGAAINYSGGLLVHADGHLYAVVRGVLYKIDRQRFSIVASRLLPLARTSGRPNLMTTYNGIVATRTGDLILKGWASTGDGGAPGTLLRVDPRTLRIEAHIQSDAIASARMALVEEGGDEYVYFPGKTQSVRFLVQPKTFALDESWSTTYLGSGDTMASSDVFMGKGVLFAGNTSPQAATPMRVFAQGTAPDAPLHAMDAFAPREIGWNFFMMAGDPYESGIAAVQDQATGRVAGYLACDGGTSFEKRWQNDRIRSSAGMAVNYRAGHLYTDDRRCSSRRRCKLFLVVLDLRTGRELARVRVKGTKPSMGQIFVGRGAVYYVAAQTGSGRGYVTRVTVAR